VKCASFNGIEPVPPLRWLQLSMRINHSMFKNSASLRLAVLAIGCMLLCPSPVRADGSDASLYSRLGGTPVVTAFVGDLIDRASRDPHLKRAFDRVNLGRIKSHVIEQICELAGGGCKYSGDSMQDAHAGLGISEAEFFGFADVLRDSMRQHGVHLRERNELLAMLAPMKRDIVER
jgi:hemoglobin